MRWMGPDEMHRLTNESARHRDEAKVAAEQSQAAATEARDAAERASEQVTQAVTEVSFQARLQLQLEVKHKKEQAMLAWWQANEAERLIFDNTPLITSHRPNPLSCLPPWVPDSSTSSQGTSTTSQGSSRSSSSSPIQTVLTVHVDTTEFDPGAFKEKLAERLDKLDVSQIDVTQASKYEAPLIVRHSKLPAILVRLEEGYLSCVSTPLDSDSSSSSSSAVDDAKEDVKSAVRWALRAQRLAAEGIRIEWYKRTNSFLVGITLDLPFALLLLHLIRLQHPIASELHIDAFVCGDNPDFRPAQTLAFKRPSELRYTSGSSAAAPGTEMSTEERNAFSPTLRTALFPPTHFAALRRAPALQWGSSELQRATKAQRFGVPKLWNRHIATLSSLCFAFFFFPKSGPAFSFQPCAER